VSLQRRDLWGRLTNGIDRLYTHFGNAFLFQGFETGDEIFVSFVRQMPVRSCLAREIGYTGSSDRLDQFAQEPNPAELCWKDLTQPSRQARCDLSLAPDSCAQAFDGQSSQRSHRQSQSLGKGSLSGRLGEIFPA
jgi:hypothetical protein